MNDIDQKLQLLKNLHSRYELEFDRTRLKGIERDFEIISNNLSNLIRNAMKTTGTGGHLLKKQVAECYKVRLAFRDVVLGRAIRQGMLVLPDQSETKLRQCSPEEIMQMITEVTMVDASDEAQIEYDSAMERAREVVRLADSIKEISTMMSELTILVDAQSKSLDNIADNVEDAIVYVRKGNENVRASIATQKRTRKCWCLLITIGIIMIIGISVIVPLALRF